ncbi:bile acid:sodium symporter family protein [Maribacter sp. MJ134]|uniref:bile acid:sodium symporter family protein n=1 Tax=Maribacter sp. MJ134 TaxID=2496865 RepID=UPI000F84756A|nr:bile acid:sodium symporter family protein [Maribacter sp. MJ134]AZQ58785.1 bile acid:sodium symporter family protein [Maribacter sp. MJ134]
MRDVLLDNVHINFDSGSLWVLNVVLAFVMFGVALEISIKDFKELWSNPKPILIGVLSQFVLLPVTTFILILILKPYPSIALGMIMVAACPGGNISNFITHLAGGNSALSVCLTAIATLLAVIMTPLSLEFWGSLYQPTAKILEAVAISPLEMVKLVALLLGVPLLLGMSLHHFKPKLALILAKGLKPLSLLFFIALVFLALYNNSDIFMDYIFYVFWIVVLHNLLAFFTGFSISKIFKLNRKNSKSITIETGIQNSGLGLLLIFTFFDGLGGMALLTAFWGIWHLVSGLLLAGYWSNKSITKKETLA